MALGCGTWWLLDRRNHKAPPDGSAHVPVAKPARGTIEWALSLLDAPAEDALASAGDFERVAARHKRDRRLVPVSARILDLALVADVTHADVAAACAIRALELIGGLDVVRDRAAAITQRADFTRARRELDIVTAPRRRTNG